MVTMRLATLKGRNAESWANDPGKKLPSWALRREYRSTWRTHLNNSERIIAGQLVPSVPPDTAPVPVSVEDGIAKELQLHLGDELVFDVQGVLITNRVASLRKVDWRQIRPNFFVVFPAGVLESAPSMTILGTHVGDPDESAVMQRELVKAFPNVSVIDLILVLRTLNGIVDKIGFAIRIMALFTVVTGLVVLASAVGTGRTQRLREAVLLRTLGASRSQIRQSLIAEHLALGFLAAGSGSLLSVAAAWNLAYWVFNTEMVFSVLPFAVAIVSVTGVTVAMGLVASRGIGSHPPLEVLRREV
jgi:putative ABC transport system permease protein